MDEKKITVKFFLNTDVKPLQKDGQPDLYPLYVRVTYDRKTTRFKYMALGTHAEVYLPIQDDDPYEIKGNQDLRIYERTLEQVIRYEVERYQDKFNLNGIGDRLSHYDQRIIIAVAAFVKWQFDSVFQSLEYDDAAVAKKLGDNYFKLHLLLDQLGADKAQKMLAGELNRKIVLPLVSLYFLFQKGFQLTPFIWFVYDSRKRFKKDLQDEIERLVRNDVKIRLYDVLVFSGEQLEKAADSVVRFIDSVTDTLIYGELPEELDDLQNIDFELDFAAYV